MVNKLVEYYLAGREEELSIYGDDKHFVMEEEIDYKVFVNWQIEEDKQVNQRC